MKRFKFSLEPVLGHRERVEDEKQQVFSKHQRELQEALNELSRLNAEFKRYSAKLRDGHKSLRTEELRAHYAHLEYLDRRITVQQGIVTQHRAAVERARRDLVVASKDRKVIEKLKDRRFQEHRTLEALSEQKELDDANARRTLSW